MVRKQLIDLISLTVPWSASKSTLKGDDELNTRQDFRPSSISRWAAKCRRGMDTDHVDLDGSDDLRELAWMYVNCIAYHICWILGLQFGGFSDAIV